MEIGRNIEHKGEFYSVVFRWENDKTYRRWSFDTHRKAMRKFNQLTDLPTSSWLPVYEDITI